MIALQKTLRQLHLAVCLGTTPAPLTIVFRSGRVGTKRNFTVMMMSTQPRQLIQPKLPLDRRSLDHKLKKTICKKPGKKVQSKSEIWCSGNKLIPVPFISFLPIACSSFMNKTQVFFRKIYYCHLNFQTHLLLLFSHWKLILNLLLHAPCWK